MATDLLVTELTRLGRAPQVLEHLGSAGQLDQKVRSRFQPAGSQRSRERR